MTSADAKCRKSPSGPRGCEGEAGFDLPLSSRVDVEIALIGSNITDTYQPTGVPGQLEFTALREGRWCIMWYAEFMGTRSLGERRVFGRVMELEQNQVLAQFRRIAGFEKGPDTGIPTVTDFAETGDIRTWSGVAFVDVQKDQKVHAQLQYAAHDVTISNAVLRVRNQRFVAFEVEPPGPGIR